MSLLSFLGKIVASITAGRIRRWSECPVETQNEVFQTLIQEAQDTAFGKDHRFAEIKTYEDFKQRVPVRTYEDFVPYIDRIKQGELDVLWKGRPIYFCKTSGTTAGVKYIPITKASISNHLNSARNALLMYIHGSGNADFLGGKLIFLSGSPTLDAVGAIPTGRLSGIVNHHVPGYLRRNQLPSFTTNCIDDWEEKVDAIVEETHQQDMRLISGIPPWVQMYFDKLTLKTGEKAGALFPNFTLFVHGGVNFEPYRAKLEAAIGRSIHTLETYPSSEGFIAFQDTRDQAGLLLVLNEGIFYEFIPAAEYFNEKPTRLALQDVELGINYAILLNTNAGLWGYSIGDTVKFVSTNPYRIVVTGRIKHFISAFGEHVIVEEAEKAIQQAAAATNSEVVEFTVAPQVNPESGLPYHEWLVEFAQAPNDSELFTKLLDEAMQKQNIYYRDLIQGNILRTLVMKPLPAGAFIQYMKSQGKLGGQNKVPHLSNHRDLADNLLAMIK